MIEGSEITPDAASAFGAAAPRAFGIANLREELGLTQIEFGERIGLANKASISLIERGLAPCSLRVAVAIEELSGGRIDAAGLNEDVRLSRHGTPDTLELPPLSPGKAGESSPAACELCERRWEDVETRACSEAGCPRRVAA